MDASRGPEELPWLVAQMQQAHDVPGFVPRLLEHVRASLGAELAGLTVTQGPAAGIVFHSSTRKVSPVETAGIKARIEGAGPAESPEAFIHQFAGRYVTGGVYVEPLRADRAADAEQTVASAVALLEVVAALQIAREEAAHDPLTGLANRRMLGETLANAIEQGNRYGAPFSIAMIDLDHFKWLNDHFGHSEGDLVLQEVARVLKSRVRRADLAARFGGDEFLLLLPYTDADKARVLLRRIATELGQRLRRYETGSTRVGFSFGVSSFPDDGRDIDTLIRRADERLYRAKEQAGVTRD